MASSPSASSPSASSPSSIYSPKETERQDILYARQGIINFKLALVNPHIPKLFPAPSKWQKLKWFIGVAMAINYFASFGLDLWVSVDFFDDDLIAEGISYAVFSCLSILLALYEIWEAYKIVSSDDISDVFTNDQARMYYGVTSFNHYLFFNKIDGETKCNDKIALFTYSTLRKFFRLVFVEVPQLILCLMKIYANCSDCVPDPGTFLKIIQLGFSLWALAITIYAYPCLRCYLRVKYGADFNFRLYCTFLIEKHVNAIAIPLLEKEDPATLEKQREILEQIKKDNPTFSDKLSDKATQVSSQVSDQVSATTALFSPSKIYNSVSKSFGRKEQQSPQSEQSPIDLSPVIASPTESITETETTSPVRET